MLPKCSLLCAVLNASTSHWRASVIGGDLIVLASYNRCDFLVIWNCCHLANANKFDHIRRVNTMLGLFVPALVTPLELLGDDDEERR